MKFRTLALLPAILFLTACNNQAQKQETPPPTQAEESLMSEPPIAAPEGMVWIPGGKFKMGSDLGFPDEEPIHEVSLDGFYIDITEVTNAQFQEFVTATNYITEAEQTPKAEDFPGVPKEMLVPGALVLVPDPINGNAWEYIPGANWKHPRGPNSTIEDKMDHPVVQVSWNDAQAYAKWANKSLPTEAQFEFAARGGLEQQPFVWGDTKHPDGKEMANIWQGMFPQENEGTDGFLYTSPVKTFPPNGYDLYDIAGNVWEWCQDNYRPDTYANNDLPTLNPQGPETSNDPAEPGVPKRVMRGGSFLCADNYCTGYRPSARMKSTPDTGLFHTGFRCVMNMKKQ